MSAKVSRYMNIILKVIKVFIGILLTLGIAVLIYSIVGGDEIYTTKNNTTIIIPIIQIIEFLGLTPDRVYLLGVTICYIVSFIMMLIYLRLSNCLFSNIIKCGNVKNKKIVNQATILGILIILYYFILSIVPWIMEHILEVSNSGWKSEFIIETDITSAIMIVILIVYVTLYWLDKKRIA